MKWHVRVGGIIRGFIQCVIIIIVLKELTTLPDIALGIIMMMSCSLFIVPFIVREN